MRRNGVLLVLLMWWVFFVGCTGIERRHTLKVHTNVKSIDLRSVHESPGIADCGCSYTVTW